MVATITPGYCARSPPTAGVAIETIAITAAPLQAETCSPLRLCRAHDNFHDPKGDRESMTTPTLSEMFRRPLERPRYRLALPVRSNTSGGWTWCLDSAFSWPLHWATALLHLPPLGVQDANYLPHGGNGGLHAWNVIRD